MYGSAIMGFTGKFSVYLKKQTSLCCPLKKISCSECLLSANCVYFFIFESKKRISKNKSPDSPHPFILEPPLLEKKEYRAGDRFSFSLILIEDGIKWIPYVIYTVMQMGVLGVGFGIKDGLGRFKLNKVLQGNEIIYEKETNKLVVPENVLYLEVKEMDRELSRIKIDFITPYRVKFKNSLVTDFDFSVLIRACLRRISSLEETYTGKEPDIDYKGLIKRSREISLISQEKEWVEITRFSYRQKKKMKLGGLIGSAHYFGELAEFYPILKYCEVVHVGKQTSFGFGKIRVLVL
jgi:hypothetical protein